jgi:hypothetical protein
MDECGLKKRHKKENADCSIHPNQRVFEEASAVVESENMAVVAAGCAL